MWKAGWWDKPWVPAPARGLGSQISRDTQWPFSGSQSLISASVSRSVVSNSVRPRGLWPARLLCPWDSQGKSTGVGCHALLQGIFPTQGLNLGLLHCEQILYHLSHIFKHLCKVGTKPRSVPRDGLDLISQGLRMFASKRAGMILSRSFSIGVYGKEHGLACQDPGLSLNSISYWIGTAEPSGLGFLISKMWSSFHLTGLWELNQNSVSPTHILGYLWMKLSIVLLSLAYPRCSGQSEPRVVYYNVHNWLLVGRPARQWTAERLRILIQLFFFKLQDNYFTISWWLLPYINMNQPQVSICPSLPWIPMPTFLLLT